MIATWLATTAVLALSLGSTFAMWNWNWWMWTNNNWWQLSQYVTEEEKTKLHSLETEEKKVYMNELKEKYNIASTSKKEAKNPAETIKLIEKQDLNELEIDLLMKQYEEEMMAWELYSLFYEKYGVEVFKKVADSEAKHKKAVEALFERYDLEVPTDYNQLKDLYEELKSEGSKSLLDALEVWIKIERIDIEDIIEAIKSTDNNDVKVILTNIGWASYNHLRGFIKAVDTEGYTTSLDYNSYLNEDDINTKWPIKYKLAERLESEWVNLPEQVSSETLKSKTKWSKWKQMNSSNWINVNNDLKNQYKAKYESKYGSLISKMGDSELKIFISKINDIIEKVNNWDYSNSTKEKYNSMLIALKEIVMSNMNK